MRTAIAHPCVKHLEYEIRKIVDHAHRIEGCGISMTWENIGDPILMGEKVTPWIREIVTEITQADRPWAYSPSRGIDAAREFIAAQVNRRGGAAVTPEHILFFNGLGEAISRIYGLLNPGARVIMPTPCYPTHFSNEIMRGEFRPLRFHLDPAADWQPDLDELRDGIRRHPEIAAIALINPDNPTGQVYARESLEAIVALAAEFGLFIICDEIYAHICYNGAKTLHLSELLGDVPALVMRGISKEYPWPGARCGWIEMMNTDKDPDFAAYTRSLVKAKMMEVCSTTLPQMSIPRVMADARYPDHLAARAAMFQDRSNDAYEAFAEIDGLIVNRTRGAFYFPVVFADGVLDNRQSLPIENPRVRSLVEDLVRDVANDKRFVYYLMGSAGICVTPLSGFHSELQGFRITTLQADDAKRRDTLRRLAEAIREYLG